MDMMLALRTLATERRRARHNVGLCLLVGLFAACSGKPFTADGRGVTDAASGAAAGGADTSGGRGQLAPEMPAAARAGAPSNGGESAASGSAGLIDGHEHPQTGLGGAPGAAGERGTAGAAGEGAAAGAAGSGPKPAPACPHGSGAEYQLQFYSENQGAVEQEVHPFFEVLSLKGASVALNRLKFRYYYTKEADGSELGSCFWVTGDRCSLVHFAFSDLVPPTATANRVMEVSFAPSSATLGLTPIEIRTGLTVNHADLEQSNDYSFLSVALAPGSAQVPSYRPWAHVTLYVDDELVWGDEPCLTSD